MYELRSLISSLIALLVMLSGPFVLGLLIGSIALFRPLRVITRRFTSLRLALALLLGVVSMLFDFSASAWLTAFAASNFGSMHNACTSCDGFALYSTEQEEDYRKPMNREYFMRLILPPPMRSPCNTGHAIACNLLEKRSQRPSVSEQSLWRDYCRRFARSWAAAWGTAAIVGVPHWLHDHMQAGGALRAGFLQKLVDKLN